MTAGCSWPAWPTTRLPDEDLGAPARMPRQVLRRPQRDVNSAGAGDDSHRLERVGGLDRAARAPGAARFAQPGQHRRDVLRLTGQRRVERGDLVIGRPTMDRDQLDAAGLLGRLHHLRDGKQRDVDQAAGYVAAQRFQQAGQQRGGQLRAVGLQRVEHRASWCAAGRRPADPTGRTRRRAGTGSAGSRRTRTAPATCRSRGGASAPAVSPRPAGADGSTDGMTSSPPAAAPPRRGRRAAADRAASSAGSRSACRPSSAHRGTDLGEPPGGRARGVCHPGEAVRAGRRRSGSAAVTSRPAADRRASRSGSADTAPPAMSASSAAHRSSAATEMAGSTARS